MTSSYLRLNLSEIGFVLQVKASISNHSAGSTMVYFVAIYASIEYQKLYRLSKYKFDDKIYSLYSCFK